MSFHVSAQIAVIKFNNDEMKTVSVKAHSKDEVFTDYGTFKWSDIELISFDSADPYAASLVERLRGIGVNADLITADPQAITKDILSTQPSEQQVPDLSNFFETRAVGKALQFTGVAMLGYVSYMQLRNEELIQRKQSPKKINSSIPLIGLGAMGVGILIDISAGSKQRR